MFKLAENDVRTSSSFFFWLLLQDEYKFYNIVKADYPRNFSFFNSESSTIFKPKVFICVTLYVGNGGRVKSLINFVKRVKFHKRNINIT